MEDKHSTAQKIDVEFPDQHGNVNSVATAESKSEYVSPTVSDLPEWRAVTGIIITG